MSVVVVDKEKLARTAAAAVRAPATSIKVVLVNKEGRVHLNGITYVGGSVYEHEADYANFLLSQEHRDAPLFKKYVAPAAQRQAKPAPTKEPVINLTKVSGVSPVVPAPQTPPPMGRVKVELGEPDPELEALLKQAEEEDGGDDENGGSDEDGVPV